ncbi:hypothetical protein [Mycobacterium sp. NAZ190054]|uniref:hypothetical protein n=1 Tax=Mycobacterium sp. NAZ190054 TaxID=1747766 RepID=UPI000794B74D|nr:hypothetical protein [Mycobacterium sp. NAZ190054]KWX65676.1 hypothetical protein ASJ79_07725 [Mycobacterium sp. NAZ190054]
MRFVTDAGLWATEPARPPGPLTAVVELPGAVLSWTVDDPPQAPPHLAFTDVLRAEWLWRVVGEQGHADIVSALDGAATGPVEVAGPGFDATELRQLRRLATGHWLRRWWPTSYRDGILGLDLAVLDAELALLTASAQHYFNEDTLDSDVAGLLQPHTGALDSLARSGDPRVEKLARVCAELVDDLGIEAAGGRSLGDRRDDYALVAGGQRPDAAGIPIAVGAASVSWAAVPPRVFDAAENTVHWRVGADGAAATATVRTDLVGPASPAGIAVGIRSAGVTGAGLLDGAGAASVVLVDADRTPVTDTAAWNHDWRDTVVTIGAGTVETREARDRVRAFARARLRSPGPDAFLAEVLAAESDY